MFVVVLLAIVMLAMAGFKDVFGLVDMKRHKENYVSYEEIFGLRKF